MLIELLGYEHQTSSLNEDCPITPSSNPKRQKHSTSGSEEDWLYLVNSVHQNKLGNYVKYKLQLKCNQIHFQTGLTNTLQINVNSVLFPHIKLIHNCLHLLYEDLKLNVLRSDDLKLLATFLSKLSGDLGLIDYLVHYWKDFPDTCTIKLSGNIGPNERKNVNEYPFVAEKPPNIMQFIYDILQGNSEIGSYPFMNHVNVRSKDIIQVRVSTKK